MKLSAAFLAEQLNPFFSLEIPDRLPLAPALEYPALLPQGASPKDGLVYLCEPASLETLRPEEFPRNSFFLLRGTPQKKPCAPCAFLPPDADLPLVCLQVQEIFRRLNQWQEKLMRARLEGRPVQELLDASLELFGNPLVLVNMDFTPLASASSRPETIRETLFSSFGAARSHLENFRRSELYTPVEHQEQVFYLPPAVGGCASLCANIRQHKKTTHCLLLLETDRPLRRSEGFLLAFLASLLEHAFTHGPVPGVSSSEALNAVLTRALTDKTADYLAVSQRLDALGWKSGHDYCCVFFSLDSFETQKKSTAQRSVCRYLEHVLNDSAALSHNGDIVWFVNMTLSVLTSDELVRHLSPFLEESGLTAGMSRRMTGHLNLRRQYLQARIALRTGLGQQPERRLHLFNQISFRYILEQSTRRLPGYMVCDENLWKLREHDEKNGSDYMQTLRLYLDNQCSVVQTARELSIHRSTLLYRLEKIREILACSLDDPKHLLYLRLSFYFIEMEEEKQNPYCRF